MKTNQNSKVITERSLSADFIVVGGGLSGLCAAVAAARHGVSVILIQDRPMLGGNASSECRMGIMGAKGDNNKETGLLEEVQLDNIYRNPLMRYTLWDDAMLNLVIAEPNITLLLNTSVHEVLTENNAIKTVKAWNINEYCEYTSAENSSQTVRATASSASPERNSASAAKTRRNSESIVFTKATTTRRWAIPSSCSSAVARSTAPSSRRRGR